MIVIKLGGSLMESGALADCLRAIDNRFRGMSVAIVPGGGAFADQVRLSQQRWQFDDGTAHRMALLAMQQMALLCRGLKPHFQIEGSVSALQTRLNQNSTMIWSPDIRELDHAGIPPSWDVTSDSLAAWLANTLSAGELILIKSANIEAGDNLDELAAQNIVDPLFCNFVSGRAYKITIINCFKFLNG